MTSIIDYFNENNLYFAVEGTNISEGDAYSDALEKDDKYFASYDDPPHWQITFDRLVTIGSYTLKSYFSFGDWFMVEWNVSYSADGDSFIFLQTNTLKYKNIKYPLKKPIKCKSLRITGFLSSDGTDDLIFNSFDCFSDGSLKRTRNLCSCNFHYYKRRLTISFLLTLFPSFLT